MIHSADRAYKTMHQQQDEIIDAFATLAGDRAAMLDYLIDLGMQLAPMDPIYKTDGYLVSGCMSKVWLADTIVDKRLFLQADSNTVITKGLMSLLVKVYSGQPLQEVVATDLYFIQAIGIDDLVGLQRSNGLAHMIKAIKLSSLGNYDQVSMQQVYQ
ncbi:MAG: SufE family protein [Amoebophilaceae bacterium]|nr:SufE family protein [Amoebophilaceae bacterium]